MAQVPPDPDAQRGKIFRPSLPVFGIVVFVFSAVAIGENVYEQTVLTWLRGPQMTGFSIVHLHPFLLILGSAGILLVHFWLAWFVFQNVKRRLQRRGWLGRQRTVLAVLSAILLVLLYIPYPWWTSLTLMVAGPGQGALELLASAALEEQQSLVDELLSRGVAIDEKDRDGDTALETACRNHHTGMADYLVKRGANLDAAPSCRQYLDFASRMKPDNEAIREDGLPKVPATTVGVNSSSRPSTP
jgi:hypothetical protein